MDSSINAAIWQSLEFLSWVIRKSPDDWEMKQTDRPLVKVLCSTTLLHGVEHLYSRILLRKRVERSSGVGVYPYTQYKTGWEAYLLLAPMMRSKPKSNGGRERGVRPNEWAKSHVIEGQATFKKTLFKRTVEWDCTWIMEVEWKSCTVAATYRWVQFGWQPNLFITIEAALQFTSIKFNYTPTPKPSAKTIIMASTMPCTGVQLKIWRHVSFMVKI